MSNRNRNNVTTDETLEAEILASAEEIVEAEDPTTRQKVVAVLKKFAPVAVLTAIGVFVGVGVILDIEENSRGKLSMSLSVLIIFMPILIGWVLGKLLPNAPL